MKIFLKWVAYIFAGIVAVPLLIILAFWIRYHIIVSAHSSHLAVPVASGVLGEKVNAFSGTGGYFWMCGHDTPAATTPFGMVRLGPDTETIIFHKRGLNRAGYYYGDDRLIGFSHTRLVGADAQDGGVLRVFPTVESRIQQMRKKDRFARFSHKKETAFPGYYAVYLPKDRISVELTATPRVGVHRYTFQKHDVPHLLLDVTSGIGDHCAESGSVTVLPDAHELEGMARCKGTFSSRYGGLDVYFVARFDKPFTQFGTWSRDRFTPNSMNAAGNDVGVDIAFGSADSKTTIEVRVAISYVSIANARLNLDTEAPLPQPFEGLFQRAKEQWEDHLSLIRVKGGTETQQRIFYTCLYHAFLMPTLFCDVNGDYIGFDRAIHKAEGFRYFTDFSLWDTFRTTHPLYNLIARKDQRDMLVSLVEMAKAGGCLPRWPSGCGYTGSMFGTPADMVVTEAYLKGIRDFDVATAYQSMRQVALSGVPKGSSFSGRDNLDSYLSLGYIASDKGSKSVAATLEYCGADHALSLLADELGHEDDATLFAQHAQFYRNLWDPTTQYFRPRDAQGFFSTPFKPLMLTYEDYDHKYTDAYVEGSALQWRWAVPYDAEGLVSLFRSREYFVSELNTFFEKSRPKMGGWHPGPYYWHGNEPDIHAVYLFNAAGRPDLAQRWVRWILDTRYTDDYVGLDGNDDGGTLSAWYVLSALGFYPIAGTARYELGAPLFESADVYINGNRLTILASNYAPENYYVKKVFLNDKPLDRMWIMHDEIAKGGTLRFEMSATPSVAS